MVKFCVRSTNWPDATGNSSQAMALASASTAALSHCPSNVTRIGTLSLQLRTAMNSVPCSSAHSSLPWAVLVTVDVAVLVTDEAAVDVADDDADVLAVEVAVVDGTSVVAVDETLDVCEDDAVDVCEDVAVVLTVVCEQWR